MKRLAMIVLVCVVFSVLFFLLPSKYSNEYAIKINSFNMTADEFETYLKEMNYNQEDTPEARERVLEGLIDKKLILQEAEKQGLHKSKEFLLALEGYYEQLLFRLIVDEKSKELGSQVTVLDREIKRRYNEMTAKEVLNKPYEEAYNQIKWQIFREKQTQALEVWLKELKEKSRIEIDKETILNK